MEVVDSITSLMRCFPETKQLRQYTIDRGTKWHYYRTNSKIGAQSALLRIAAETQDRNIFHPRHSGNKTTGNDFIANSKYQIAIKAYFTIASTRVIIFRCSRRTTSLDTVASTTATFKNALVVLVPALQNDQTTGTVLCRTSCSLQTCYPREIIVLDESLTRPVTQ